MTPDPRPPLTAPLAAAISQLSSPPPALTREDVAQALAARYGLTGTLSPLHGERDLNFRLDTPDGGIFALKVVNRHESAEETALLTAMMVHVDTPGLPVARVVRDRDGAPDTAFTAGGDVWRMRLVSWLDGAALRDVAPSLALSRNTGDTIGRVARRLADFHTDVPARRILWDSSRVDELGMFTQHVRDAALRERIDVFLGFFTDFRATHLQGLRRQLIHNDYNPSNITIDHADHTRVAGLVDFGDSCEAPLVNELAVAASYQLGAPEGPYAAIAAMTGAFARIIPLTDAEIAALLPLVQARVVTRIIMTEWRAAMLPDNADYIRRALPQAVGLMDFFDACPAPEARAMLDMALKTETSRP